MFSWVKLGVFTQQVLCIIPLCDICRRCVSAYFGNKRIKDTFKLFYSLLLPIICLPILATNLQVNIYQINFIIDFMKEIGPKTKAVQYNRLFCF